MKAPLHGLIAEKDGNVTPQVVKKLDDELTTHGKAHEFTIYPGAQYAFFNHLRPEVHDPKASGDAWQQLNGWFGHYLGFTEDQLNSDEQLKSGYDSDERG